MYPRPGRCLLRWMNDGSNGVKSFVLGLNSRPFDTKDRRHLNHCSTIVTNIAQV